jgi:hypothetical protein
MLRERLRYEKRGPMRFTSHRDLMRIFRRAFAAADVPVSFSQGFNPHPRLSFGPSLRTGWEGFDEYMDVLLESPDTDLAPRCNGFLPEGLRILETGSVGERVPKLAADVTGARYEIIVDPADVFERRTELEQPVWESLSGTPAEGEGDRSAPERVLSHLETGIRGRYSDTQNAPSADEPTGPPAPAVLDVRCVETRGIPGSPVMIEYLSTMHGGKSLFPEDVLTPFLGDPYHYRVPLRVARKALYVARGGALVSPMSRAAMETHA